MPHTFFERLERRRSTQALLGNISTNGLSGFSSFSSSAPSSISGSYGFPMYCYALGPEWLRGLEGPWGGMIFEPSKLPIGKSSTQQPWLNPSYQSPSWNYLNNWTSPIQQPWLTPSSWPSTRFPTSIWTSPLNQKYPVGLGLPGGGLGFPGGGLGNPGGGLVLPNLGPMCYAFGGMSGIGGGISKLKKVRKNLLAFFQNKGILTDKQRQRLLSSAFDKA
jgi:hypothetical protein